ncbi:MAG: hypothetical protein DHS20C18_10050 [Saprospiraceae bacterium]|nr:MAG: hypothetical protein DHS20C18_10050 [Saprospiraceae bacterium]
MKSSHILFTGFLLLVFLTTKAQSDFYQIDKIQQINITFEQDNWRYLLDSLRYNGREMLAGVVEINGEKIEKAGVRYRDGRVFTPGAKRNGLYIQLDLNDPAKNYLGFKAIDLSSALRDPSMVREVTAHEIARKYMPAPAANYAKVYINKDYYGLFVNVEVVDENFIQRNFFIKGKALFHCDPNTVETVPDNCNVKAYGSLQKETSKECFQFHFEAIMGNDWPGLMELTQSLDGNEKKLEKILDIDRALWMLAFNNVLVNLASYSGQYSQNYYLFKDDKGRFVPIVNHLNLAFGSFKNTGSGSDLGIRELMTLDPLLNADNEDKPMLKALLNNELFQKNYLAHMRRIVVDNFEDGKFENRSKALQQMIRPHLMEDENRYYEMEEFDKSLTAIIGKRSRIPGLVDFMEKRIGYLNNLPGFTVVPPDISAINVTKRERFSTNKIEDFKIQATVDQYTKKVSIFYRFDDEGQFMEKMMADDGKNNDGEANDGTFGIEIQPENGAQILEYYIFAENAKSVSYDPPNYMYQRHFTSLSELNK